MSTLSDSREKTGLAIFDLDNTLITGDSDHAWGDFLIETGVVDAETHRKANNQFYQDYLDGTLDMQRYLEFSLQPLAEHPMAQLHQWREAFIERKILPLITQKSLQLLAEHRERGHYLLIITATNRFVTEPIARHLGVDDLIATDPELADGRYTGRVSGIPSFQAGKVTRLDQWLTAQGRIYPETWFYSDSHNDVPLLEKVNNPIAVDPDPTLEKLAQSRGWPIISLRD